MINFRLYISSRDKTHCNIGKYSNLKARAFGFFLLQSMAQLLINIVLKGRFGGQFVDYNASLMLNTRTH